MNIGYLLTAFTIICGWYRPQSSPLPGSQELEITLDSAFLVKAHDSLTWDLVTVLTIKNTSGRDIVVMEYECRSNNITSSFGLIAYDSATSKLYTLPQLHVYDINPEMPTPSSPRFELYQHFFLKKGESKSSIQKFRISESGYKPSIGTGQVLVNINDRNYPFMGKLSNLEVKVVLFQNPCLQKTDSTHINLFKVDGTYVSNWVKIK